MSETDIEEVLDIIGFGLTQVVMIFASGLVLVLAVTEVVGISILGVATQAEFKTTDVQKSYMFSAGGLGMIVASHFMGYQMDLIGRRCLLLISATVGTCLSVLSSFMPNFWLFVIFRFLVGICVAGYSSTNITYIVEFTEARKRSQVANCITYFAAIGTLYFAILATFILPMDINVSITNTFVFKSWRVLIWFYTFPGVILIIVFYTLPESSKYLISVNQNVKAYEVLNRICFRKHGKGLEDYGVTSVVLANFTGNADQHVGFFKGLYVHTKPLLKRPYVFGFVTNSLISFCLFAVGNGMLIWFPKLRNCDDVNGNLTFCATIEDNRKHGGASNITVCHEHMYNFTDNIVIGIALLLGCISVSIVLNWVSRTSLLFIYPLISATCALLLNIVKHQLTKLLLLCCFITLPSTLFNMIVAVVVDIIPTDLRGKAVCLVYLAGRIGSVCSMSFIGKFIGCYCNFTLISLATVMLIATLLNGLVHV